MVKKLLSLVMAMIICLSAMALFSSCGGEDDISSNGETPQADAETQERDIVLVENGVSKYKLVYSSTANADMLSMVYTFRNTFEEKTGVRIEHVRDTTLPTEYEIILGNTRREESNALAEEVGYLGYSLKLSGNKVIMFAYDNIGLTRLVANFFNTAKMTDGNYVYNGSNNNSGVTNKLMNSIPRYEGEKINTQGFYDCGDDVTQLSINHTTEAEFTSYLSKLEGNGYAIHAKNTFGASSFATYTKGENQIHVAFWENLEQVKIYVEETTYLPAVEAESYTPVVTPSVIIPVNKYRGLGLVFQLSDGRFVIIDGGDYDLNVVGEEFCKDVPKNLYDALDQNKVGDKIKIAAWIFTHPHDDHMTAAFQFMEVYHSKVEIEMFAYNFVDPDAYDSFNEDTVVTSYRNRLNNYRKTYFSDAEVFKFHTGQQLKLCDATITFVYTQEDFFPRAFTNGNEASAGMMIEIKGTKTLVLGDMEVECNERIAEAYAEALETDILSPAHHGLNGGTIKLYQYLKPSMIIWGTTDEKFNTNNYNGIKSVRGYEHSMYFINNKGITHYTQSTYRRIELPLQ